jgi:hypothetical protein
VGVTTVGNLQLTSSGALQLRDGSTQIGANSIMLSVGTLYLIGIHRKRGGGVYFQMFISGDAASVLVP